MKRVVVSERADDDLFDILGGLAESAGWSVAQAYGERILRVYELIAERPEIFAPRRKLGRFVRAAVVRPYLIFYSYEPGENVINIVRVLHGRRDIKRSLLA